MMWLSHTGRDEQAIITKKGMLIFPPVHRTVFFSVRLRRHDIVFNEDNPPQVLYVTEKLRLSTRKLKMQSRSYISCIVQEFAC